MSKPLNNHETSNPLTTDSRYNCRMALSVSFCHSEAGFRPVRHVAKNIGEDCCRTLSSADRDGMARSSGKSSGDIVGLSHTEILTIPSGAPAIRVLAVERKLPEIELLNDSVMNRKNSTREGAVTREKKTTRRNVRAARIYANLFTEKSLRGRSEPVGYIKKTFGKFVLRHEAVGQCPIVFLLWINQKQCREMRNVHRTDLT